jgi:hypothetical protein
MGQLDHSLATLRIFGDDLDPEEISSLLGAQPTESWKKGDELRGKVTGSVRIAKTGMWRIKAMRREPENLVEQIHELLGQLSTDLAVWRTLSERYKLDLFCGIFMRSGNDGLELSAESLSALGERQVFLNLDIYDASDD